MSFVQNFRSRSFPTLAEQLGYTDKDILVIVNIDDVGLHEDETEASFRALNFGMVKTGSIMVPCVNFDRVIELWKKYPDIDFGVHLTLTCEWGRKYPWAPILSKAHVPGLYNPDGIMWSDVPEVLQHANEHEIEKELEAQINMVLDTGLIPSHIDYHMDFHHHSDLLSIILRLSRKYKLILRPPKRRKFRFPLIKNNLYSLRRKGYIFPDTQMGTYMLGGPAQSLAFRMSKYHDHLQSLEPGVHNIKVHIAFQTKELENIVGKHSSSIRQIDYDVWTSNKTKELAENLGISFINFRPLQKLQRYHLNK